MADVAAKDGSQETFVNLIASNIGIFLLPLITEEKYVPENRPLEVCNKK
jgi:hypothetical protein